MRRNKPLRTYANVRLRARNLRKEMTPAEKLLWERLRNRQLGGFKFRRQAPMGTFIADFYNAESKLIIEIDGQVHDSQMEYDQLRTETMECFGYRVIRFQNVEIEQNLNGVLSKILEACLFPSPRIGRGERGEGKPC